LIFECILVWFLQKDVQSMVELDLVVAIFHRSQMLSQNGMCG
jgi:hypothetical protein